MAPGTPQGFILSPYKREVFEQIRPIYLCLFFKNLFIYFFGVRGRQGEREGEKHQCVVASCMSPTENLARNPGMCPDWESNSDPLVCRPGLSPLSHTSQGQIRPIYYVQNYMRNFVKQNNNNNYVLFVCKHLYQNRCSGNFNLP